MWRSILALLHHRSCSSQHLPGCCSSQMSVPRHVRARSTFALHMKDTAAAARPYVNGLTSAKRFFKGMLPVGTFETSAMPVLRSRSGGKRK
jgi:hypothetical protein